MFNKAKLSILHTLVWMKEGWQNGIIICHFVVENMSEKDFIFAVNLIICFRG